MPVVPSFHAVRSGAPHRLTAIIRAYGEHALHSTPYLVIRLRVSMLSLLSDGFTPPATNFRHAALSSAFLVLRQVVISSASGIYALQSLNTSGVQACRASAVSCAMEVAGEAITAIKGSSKHHSLSGFNRRRIHPSWPLAFIGRFLPSALNVTLMIAPDTMPSYLALVQKRLRL